MVLKPLETDVGVNLSGDGGYFAQNYRKFKQKFCGLLCSSFRSMEYKLAMSVVDPEINFEAAESTTDGLLTSINEHISPYDLELLQAYTDNLADYTLIWDLVPVLARLYFQERMPVKLSYVQASILLCTGLQNHDVSYIEGQMKLERHRILSFFIKMMKKFYTYVYGIASKEIEATLPPKKEFELKPHKITLEEDLDDAANQVKANMKSKADESLDLGLLKQYAIEDDFESALQNGGGKIPSSGIISVKSTKGKPEKQSKESNSKSEKKRGKDDRGGKSNKRRKP